MKTHSSKASICVRGEFGIVYRLCEISYFADEEGSFRYVFKPHYEVIELIAPPYFEGIPGLDLDLRREEYTRENRVPVFISERVPGENRADLQELLEKVGLDRMEPLEYLLRTKEQYFGDPLFLLPCRERRSVALDGIKGKQTNSSLIRRALEAICYGDEVKVGEVRIDSSNSRLFFEVFSFLYRRSYEQREEARKEGIEKAKAEGRYKGRKPIPVDTMGFLEALEKVEKKELSPKEAAKRLGISIDKYYRLKRKLKER